MLFNSTVFLKFFGAFLLLYWLVRGRLRARNVLIVLASYLFYGWWDYRFLGLLLASSLLDYGVGLALMGTADPRKRKAWLALSLGANLAMLGFFKYYDFFIGSAEVLLNRLGVPFHPRTLGIILPVGISFYTFQTMSYVIDVYRGKLPATRQLVNFLAYVSFFPQLVAGPIERATHLLPQFEKTRLITREMIENGLWLIVLGMFKKVVLADNLAPLVEMVYQGSSFSGPMVVLGTIAFAFQIYCDFSGYSDIARGTALFLGFDLMVNFNLPYAATSPREFWRRWHISLSDWVKDYLFTPLQMAFRSLGPAAVFLSLAIGFFLVGLWHGAGWGFIVLGSSQALWIAASLLTRGWRKRLWQAAGLERSRLRALIQVLVTLQFTWLALLLFKAGDAAGLQAAFKALTRGWSLQGAGAALLQGLGAGLDPYEQGALAGGLLVMIAVHGLGRRLRLPEAAAWLRWSAYAGLLLSLLFFGRYFAQTGFLYARL